MAAIERAPQQGEHLLVQHSIGNQVGEEAVLFRLHVLCKLVHRVVANHLGGG